jgi:hypothetical protein
MQNADADTTFANQQRKGSVLSFQKFCPRTVCILISAF